MNGFVAFFLFSLGLQAIDWWLTERDKDKWREMHVEEMMKRLNKFRL